ncbi:MAG: hypothetical protein QMD85_01200, partial [Candidatus Aenigmarchaeota archaeon]|nr:hypothetical protein [Candidatus Aenigmarchaeota archaeon]MDI6722160.1 hypothetical protein [Candidatus Aenigmarchaeota archaeon]
MRKLKALYEGLDEITARSDFVFFDASFILGGTVSLHDYYRLDWIRYYSLERCFIMDALGRAYHASNRDRRIDIDVIHELANENLDISDEKLNEIARRLEDPRFVVPRRAYKEALKIYKNCRRGLRFLERDMKGTKRRPSIGLITRNVLRQVEDHRRGVKYLAAFTDPRTYGEDVTREHESIRNKLKRNLNRISDILTYADTICSQQGRVACSQLNYLDGDTEII